MMMTVIMLLATIILSMFPSRYSERMFIMPSFFLTLSCRLLLLFLHSYSLKSGFLDVHSLTIAAELPEASSTTHEDGGSAHIASSRNLPRPWSAHLRVKLQAQSFRRRPWPRAPKAKAQEQQLKRHPKHAEHVVTGSTHPCKLPAAIWSMRSVNDQSSNKNKSTQAHTHP